VSGSLVNKGFQVANMNRSLLTNPDAAFIQALAMSIPSRETDALRSAILKHFMCDTSVLEVNISVRHWLALSKPD
jgi:hypothetical protein